MSSEQQYTDQELLHEGEWRKCADDPDYFFTNYLFVRHPSKGRIPFVMRDAQRETLQQFLNEDRVIILKARQIGFSTLCAAYVLWLCLFHADILVVMLSKTQRDAQDLLRKSTYAYDALPQWMKDRGPKVLQRQLQKLSFNNDSEIESLPSAEDPARGKSVSLVIVDEWASLPSPEEAWASIEPITDIGGRLIGLSTAKGWGNFFHTLWSDARKGENGFCPIFFSWDAVPERDADWYERKRKSMLPWQLAQEYPRNEVEAFIKSGRVVFDTEMLQEKVEVQEPKMVGNLYSPTGNPKAAEFRPNPAGYLSIWGKPLLEHTYAIGADVAEGLEHGDYSVAHVIDVKSGRVVAVFHGHVDPDLFGEELAQLGFWYNTALLGIEINNHGLTTVQSARRAGYPRLYFRHALDEATKKQSIKLGWRTDRKSKPWIVDELQRAIRDDELHVHHQRSLEEMLTFVRNEKGQMEGSPHDDCVMSLAIAAEMTKFAFAPEFTPPKVEKWGTGEWWEKQTTQYIERHRVNRMGAHNVRRSA